MLRKASTSLLSPPNDIMLALVHPHSEKLSSHRGAPQWAIEELEDAVKLVPNHPAFHDMHWVLAQAYLCAASTGKSAGLHDEDVQPLEKRAVELLGDIRQQRENARIPAVWRPLWCAQFSMGVADLSSELGDGEYAGPTVHIEGCVDLDITCRSIGADSSKPSRPMLN